MFAARLCALGLVVRGAAEVKWVQKEPAVPAYSSETSAWAKDVEKPAEDQPITLTVALRVDETRRAELERVFWEVSDPEHEQYGRHLSVEQVTDLLAMPRERIERVKAYFESKGAAAKVAPNGDMITVTMSVPAAEAALNTVIHSFTHKEHVHVRILRSSRSYSLPAEIAEDVDMVGELLQFPRLALKELSGLIAGGGSWPNACDASGCQGLVTPAVIAQRYKLPEANTSIVTSNVSSAGSKMAVAEFQEQWFVPSDLASFSTSCHRDVKVDTVVGGNKPSAGVEAELDIEYIKSVAPSLPLTVIYSSEYSLLNWANQITSMSDAPQVHSVSYGNDERQQTSAEYMYTCNTAFMKAGARGLSILFASGDQGVCGREGCGFFRKSFKPDFPGGSPYVTVVGGTDFAGSSIGEETAWSASGGGFSDTFAMPAYQQAAVAAYKSNPDAKLPPQSLWNATGRGYPDVSALAGQKAPYCIASGGNFEGVAGTSAACPVVAGVFARLNALRLAAGKSALGFLNPFIYKNPSGFQDVTSGCNGHPGFTAVKGWDPATGFGTPDFEKLSGLVMVAGDQKVATLVV